MPEAATSTETTTGAAPAAPAAGTQGEGAPAAKGGGPETTLGAPPADGAGEELSLGAPTGDEDKAAAGGEVPKGNEAPAELELKLKAPEGFDAGELDAFKAWAKESGLSSAQAQAAFDREVKRFEGLADEVAEGSQAQIEEWGAALKADKELGGARLKENFALAQRGLEKVGSPELKAFLFESGLGSHPEVVRAFYRVGKLTAEDSSAGASGGAGPGPDAPLTDQQLAKQLYPEMYAPKE